MSRQREITHFRICSLGACAFISTCARYVLRLARQTASLQCVFGVYSAVVLIAFLAVHSDRLHTENVRYNIFDLIVYDFVVVVGVIFVTLCKYWICL